MPQTNELFFAFLFFAALLGFVVAAILLFVNRNQSLAPRLLAIYLLCFSLTILHIGLSFTEFYLHYPHFWRSTAWTTFCAPVVACLYVRTVLYQSFRLKKTDWLLFLPAILYTLSLLPFYTSSTSEKLVVVSNFMIDKTLIAKEPEGILPLGWGVMIRFLLGLLLLTGQYVMLVKMRRRIFLSTYGFKQNQTVYRWLLLFTSFLFLFYVVLTIEHIFHLSGKPDLTTLIFFTMGSTIFFISIYLLMRPNILYGFQGWLHPVSELTPSSENKVLTEFVDHHIPEPLLNDKKPYLTAEQGKLYKLRFENHFNLNKPFLKPGFKIRDLCEQLDLPYYLLSAFINQEYGKNFNELVNEYRLNYLEELLVASPEFYNYTIEALGGLAGFNSRATFILAVKKKTGRTPLDHFWQNRLEKSR